MKRLILYFAIALTVVSASTVTAAEPLTDARIELIRQNCTEAQSTMQQVLRSDTASRVNRGRIYEETIKLLAALNSRAALNTYNVPELISTTASFESEFSAFKDSFITYETAIKDTSRMKCKDQPVTFYDSLTNVRDLRNKLNDHTIKLNQYLDAYSAGLDKLDAQIKLRSGVTQ